MRDKLGSILMYLGFPRFLRFVPPTPELWTEFRITENCNSKCTTCYAWRNKSVDELTTQEAKNALKQLKDVGVKNVIFLGGEPLLRKDIGELIKEASLLKFEAIIVVTNGLLLEDKAEELLENGATHITVSVDGFEHTDDVIRGVLGSYEKAVRGIKTVQKSKNDKGLKTTVTLLTTILLNQNVDEIPKLVETSQSLGVYWSFNIVDPNLDIFKGIPFSSLLVKDEEKIDRTIDYLKKIRNEQPGIISPDVFCDHMLEYARNYMKDNGRYNFHCIHGYKMVYLGPHGEVYPGCWAMEPMGNIRESKLRDIIKSKEYRERAERMYFMECPGCTNRFQPNIAMKHLIAHKFRCERHGEKRTQS